MYYEVHLKNAIKFLENEPVEIDATSIAAKADGLRLAWAVDRIVSRRQLATTRRIGSQ